MIISNACDIERVRQLCISGTEAAERAKAAARAFGATQEANSSRQLLLLAHLPTTFAFVACACHSPTAHHLLPPCISATFLQICLRCRLPEAAP